MVPGCARAVRRTSLATPSRRPPSSAPGATENDEGLSSTECIIAEPAGADRREAEGGGGPNERAVELNRVKAAEQQRDDWRRGRRRPSSTSRPSAASREEGAVPLREGEAQAAEAAIAKEKELEATREETREKGKVRVVCAPHPTFPIPYRPPPPPPSGGEGDGRLEKEHKKKMKEVTKREPRGAAAFKVFEREDTSCASRRDQKGQLKKGAAELEKLEVKAQAERHEAKTLEDDAARHGRDRPPRGRGGVGEKLESMYEGLKGVTAPIAREIEDPRSRAVRRRWASCRPSRWRRPNRSHRVEGGGGRRAKAAAEGESRTRSRRRAEGARRTPPRKAGEKRVPRHVDAEAASPTRRRRRRRGGARQARRGAHEPTGARRAAPEGGAAGVPRPGAPLATSAASPRNVACRRVRRARPLRGGDDDRAGGRRFAPRSSASSFIVLDKQATRAPDGPIATPDGSQRLYDLIDSDEQWRPAFYFALQARVGRRPASLQERSLPHSPHRTPPFHGAPGRRRSRAPSRRRRSGAAARRGGEVKDGGRS